MTVKGSQQNKPLTKPHDTTPTLPMPQQIIYDGVIYKKEKSEQQEKQTDDNYFHRHTTAAPSKAMEMSPEHLTFFFFSLKKKVSKK